MVMAGWAAACVACVRAGAQVALRLDVPDAAVMVYEEIQARLAVRNDAGRLLVLGEGGSCDATLRLYVMRDGYRMMKRRDDRPLLAPTTLLPGDTQTVRLPLASLFDLRTAGRYTLRAAVEVGNASYTSPETEVTIAEGVEFGRVTAGVPGAEGVSRTYVASYFHKGPGEYLYLRIEDPAGTMVYGLFNVGRVIRVRQPELRVDGAGNAHVLFQTLGAAYIHAAFTPFGVPLFSRTLAGAGGRASLELMPSGRIEVPGAVNITEPAPDALEAAPRAPPASGRPPPARDGLFRWFQKKPAPSVP